jgi:hypothetical protein
VPANSAPVERELSQSGLIVSSRRANMSDSLLETLTSRMQFINTNHEFIGNTKLQIELYSREYRHLTDDSWELRFNYKLAVIITAMHVMSIFSTLKIIVHLCIRVFEKTILTEIIMAFRHTCIHRNFCIWWPRPHTLLHERASVEQSRLASDCLTTNVISDMLYDIYKPIFSSLHIFNLALNEPRQYYERYHKV